MAKDTSRLSYVPALPEGWDVALDVRGPGGAKITAYLHADPAVWRVKVTTGKDETAVYDCADPAEAVRKVAEVATTLDKVRKAEKDAADAREKARTDLGLSPKAGD